MTLHQIAMITALASSTAAITLLTGTLVARHVRSVTLGMIVIILIGAAIACAVVMIGTELLVDKPLARPARLILVGVP